MPKVLDPISNINPLLDTRSEESRDLLSSRLKYASQLDVSLKYWLEKEKDYALALIDVENTAYELIDNEKDVEHCEKLKDSLKEDLNSSTEENIEDTEEIEADKDMASIFEKFKKQPKKAENET